MIKSVSGNGKYMLINMGHPRSTYMNNSSGYMNVGDMRYNPQMQRIEVYDGLTWMELGVSHAQIGLTSDAENAIDWAIKKQREDMELEALSKYNPTIADLVEQKKNLDHKIKMVQILSKEESKIGTS